MVVMKIMTIIISNIIMKLFGKSISWWRKASLPFLRLLTDNDDYVGGGGVGDDFGDGDDGSSGDHEI